MRHHLTMQTFLILIFLQTFTVSLRNRTLLNNQCVLRNNILKCYGNMQSYMGRYKYKLVRYVGHSFFGFFFIQKLRNINYIFTLIHFLRNHVSFGKKFEQEVQCMHFTISNGTSGSQRQKAVLGRNSEWSGWRCCTTRIFLS